MKKIIITICVSAITLFSVTSCDVLGGIDNGGGDGEADLTTAEIVSGLKTALEIGTDSATNILSLTDGYLKDEAVKILLPPEVDVIYSNLNTLDSYAPGTKATVEAKLDDLILAINRSAEDAAKDAAPIFSNAITSLSIEDGWNILNGITPTSSKSYTEDSFDSLAATNYLKDQTFDNLVDLYSVPMNASLSKPFVGNVSANQIWNTVTTNYNQAAGLANTASSLFGGQTFNQINTDIGEYVTGKALDGLFLKVGNEEKKIRLNPTDWAIDIIQKVFGSVLDKI